MGRLRADLWKSYIIALYAKYFDKPQLASGARDAQNLLFSVLLPAPSLPKPLAFSEVKDVQLVIARADVDDTVGHDGSRVKEIPSLSGPEGRTGDLPAALSLESVQLTIVGANVDDAVDNRR